LQRKKLGVSSTPNLSAIFLSFSRLFIADVAIDLLYLGYGFYHVVCIMRP
jgi:hypothetical protein